MDTLLEKRGSMTVLCAHCGEQLYEWAKPCTRCGRTVTDIGYGKSYQDSFYTKIKGKKVSFKIFDTDGRAQTADTNN